MHKKYDTDALLVVAIPISCATLPPSLLQVNGTRTRIQSTGGVQEHGGKKQPMPPPAPAPGQPCAQPVGYQGYSPPPILQPNFNPQLQKFLVVEPPPVNTKTVIPILPVDPFDLNAFMDGGNFIEYSGSTTNPPCAEIVTGWFAPSQ